MVVYYVRLTLTSAISYSHYFFERFSLIFREFFFSSSYLPLYQFQMFGKWTNQNRIAAHTNTLTGIIIRWMMKMSFACVFMQWCAQLILLLRDTTLTRYRDGEREELIYIFIIIIKDPSKQSHLIYFICYYYYSSAAKIFLHHPENSCCYCCCWFLCRGCINVTLSFWRCFDLNWIILRYCDKPAHTDTHTQSKPPRIFFSFTRRQRRCWWWRRLLKMMKSIWKIIWFFYFLLLLLFYFQFFILFFKWKAKLNATT